MRSIMFTFSLFVSVILHSQSMFNPLEVVQLIGKPKSLTAAFMHKHVYWFKRKDDVFELWTRANDVEGDYQVRLAMKNQLVNAISFQTDQGDREEIEQLVLQNGFKPFGSRKNFGAAYIETFRKPEKNLMISVVHSINEDDDRIQVSCGHIK
jgi:hypothetical protein